MRELGGEEGGDVFFLRVGCLDLGLSSSLGVTLRLESSRG